MHLATRCCERCFILIPWPELRVAVVVRSPPKSTPMSSVVLYCQQCVETFAANNACISSVFAMPLGSVFAADVCK